MKYDIIKKSLERRFYKFEKIFLYSNGNNFIFITHARSVRRIFEL